MSTIAPGWSFGFVSHTAACALLRTRKYLLCQGCLLCSILGTCWWNILCHLRLAWHCCNPCEVKLLESCWDGLTAAVGSCSPHSPSCRHSSLPGIFQPCSWWQVPQPSLLETHQAFLPCSFDAFRFIPWPKPGTAMVAFPFSQIVWEDLRTSARSAAVYCSMCAKAVCRQHREFDRMSDTEPHLPSRSFALLCLPDCGGVPAQGTLDSHCSQASVFPISLMTQSFASKFSYVLQHSCRRKDTCSVIKLSPACRQMLRSVCGCAVTHISWDADVF